MAIGFQGTSGTRRIRFTSNVSYEGTDYGPDYEQQEVDIAPNEAYRFVQEGRAQYVEPAPATEATGLDTKTQGAGKALVRSRAGGGRK